MYPRDTAHATSGREAAVEAAAAATAPEEVAVEPRPAVVREVRDGATARARAPDGDAPRDARDADSKANVDVAAGRGVTAAGARAVARAAHLADVCATRRRVSAAARISSGTAARMACDHRSECKCIFRAKTCRDNRHPESIRVITIDDRVPVAVVEGHRG